MIRVHSPARFFSFFHRHYCECPTLGNYGLLFCLICQLNNCFPRKKLLDFWNTLFERSGAAPVTISQNLVAD